METDMQQHKEVDTLRSRLPSRTTLNTHKPCTSSQDNATMSSTGTGNMEKSLNSANATTMNWNDISKALLFVQSSPDGPNASTWNIEDSTNCNCANKPTVSSFGHYESDNGAADGLADTVKVGAAVSHILAHPTTMKITHNDSPSGIVHAIVLGPIYEGEEASVERAVAETGINGHCKFLVGPTAAWK